MTETEPQFVPEQADFQSLSQRYHELGEMLARAIDGADEESIVKLRQEQQQVYDQMIEVSPEFKAGREE